MNDNNQVGIKQQILAATSVSQIQALLAKVKGYHFAHPSTVRKCQRAADLRIEQLFETTPTPLSRNKRK